MSAPLPSRKCENPVCQASNCPLQCSRCKQAFFCNQACQKAAWKRVHKASCHAQQTPDAAVPSSAEPEPTSTAQVMAAEPAHSAQLPACWDDAGPVHIFPHGTELPAASASGPAAPPAGPPSCPNDALPPVTVLANGHCSPSAHDGAGASGHTAPEGTASPHASEETSLQTSSPPKPLSADSALSRCLKGSCSPTCNGSTAPNGNGGLAPNGRLAGVDAKDGSAPPPPTAVAATKYSRQLELVPELASVPEHVRPHVRVLRYFRPLGPHECGYGEAVPLPLGGCGEEDGCTHGLEVSRRAPVRLPDCTVYLLGTGHVSKSSCEDVQAIIEAVRPQTVFFELCRSRAGILDPKQVVKVPTMSELWAGLKSGQQTPFGVIYAWFLAKVADNVDVFPGEEFRVGWRAAQDVHAAVCLGDRPVAVTVRRVWASLSAWQKVKLCTYIITGGLNLPDKATLSKMIEDVKDDHDALVAELTRAFPSIIRPLVAERDLYMSCYLQKLAALPRNKSVVAIVGKGHLKGISDSFGLDIDVKPLMEIPGSTQTRSKLSLFSSYGSYALLFCGAAYVCVTVYTRSRSASQ